MFKKVIGLFNRSSAPPTEAETALKGWGVTFRKQKDGTLLVPGDIDISGRGLERLPDLSKVIVMLSFDCSGNRLASLEGAPLHVEGRLFCQDNLLATLKGAPRLIGKGLDCSNNRLTTLEGAPLAMGGPLICTGNSLASLKDAPEMFQGLESDFGRFITPTDLAQAGLGYPDYLEKYAVMKITSAFGRMMEYTKRERVPGDAPYDRMTRQLRRRAAAGPGYDVMDY